MTCAAIFWITPQGIFSFIASATWLPYRVNGTAFVVDSPCLAWLCGQSQSQRSEILNADPRLAFQW